MADSYLSAIEALLWPDGFRRDVWMIVDGARDRRISGMLLNSYLEYSCLYAGDLPPALERAAPYLVQLEPGNLYCQRLLEQAWGNSWGIVLRCDSETAKLRRHLRQFLVVTGPTGKQLVFRYYDPRVLRVYLPTCNDGELRTVFGPIESFYVEDADPRQVVRFRRDRSGLKAENLPLAARS